MRPSLLLASLVVLAVLGLGFATFPQAEEPGRAERDGLELTFANARLDGSGDWALASAAVDAQAGRSGVRLSALPRQTALYSRNLPVFPDTCYTLAVVAKPPAGIRVRVLDTDLDETLAPLTPLTSATSQQPLSFSTKHERRIVVAIVGGTKGGKTLLEDMRLRRRPGADC